MRELEQRQRIKKRLYSRPALIILVIVLAFMARGTWEVLAKKSESGRHVESLEREKKALVQRREELEKGIANLGTEEGIKREIKEKFSVSEVGEKVAILVEPKNTSTTTGESSKSWFKRFWSAIIGK